MPFDRFMIAPLNTGLETDVKPFLIPDDAFSQLNNAYVYRGRVRKRFGSFLMNQSQSLDIAQLFSRLRINLGNTNGAGNAAGNVPGIIWKIGQAFSVGTQIFTVFQANGATYATAGTGTATYNTATGAYTITGATAATPVYFYPAEPVMGFIVYELPAISDEVTYAFDTQFAYQFTGGAWERLGAAIWTGSNSQFFWGYTYRGVQGYESFLYVTNFNTPDQIKYWDGAAWTNYAPIFNAAGDTIRTARIIVPFKDRLVLLNTVERIGGVDRDFINRCRFSQNGDPTQTTAGQQAFREDVVGKGGFIDAPTKEQIVTAQLLKDRLIVYFESSTWELVYTGNQVLPFVWQQINTELGAESTFSVIPFDKVILGVGNVGIHACNGANVERIDQKIPDAVFQIHNASDGVKRVNGIRDYNVEMVYWTFPSAFTFATFPTRVLIYNYITGSWAFNDDSITCFGYFQNQSNQTWASTATTWAEMTSAWDSGSFQSLYRQVIGGNQQGYIFLIHPDIERNSPALQITDITVVGDIVTLTIIDHNLEVDEYIVIEQAQGITGLNNNIYQVYTNVTANTIEIRAAGIVGVYTGGGTVARVSNIDILTKQYNFYMKEGRNAFVSKVDFYVDKTENGQLTVDCFTSSSTVSLLTDGQITGSLLGSNVLETSAYATIPYEDTQARVWHPVYLQADGEVVQLRIYMSDAQMRNPLITWSDFELNAMTFYATPTANRLQ